MQQLNSAIEPVATKQDIAEIKQQLSKLINGSAINSIVPDESKPVPLDRFIRSLYDEDFGEKDPCFQFLFDSRLWLEPGTGSYSLVDIRATFLSSYGEETGKRLCLIAMRDAQFNPEAFTEEDLAKVVHMLHVMVFLITNHTKFASGPDAFECSVRSDGEFLWKIAKSSPTQTTTKRKRKRHSSPESPLAKT